MANDIRPICNWPLNADGFARIQDSVEPVGGCRLPAGFRGWIVQEVLVDEFGHPVDSDDPKLDKCNHTTTPEWQAAHARVKVRKQPPTKKAVKEPVMSETVQPATETLTKDALAPETLKASVGAPPPSAADLSKVAADAGGGVNGILMALIAVVGGGGAIWKYLQSRDKAKAKQSELDHEVRMKELELNAANQQRQDDSHNECKVARESLASKVAKVEDHLADLHAQLASTKAKLEESSSALMGKTGDDDELEEQLAELSKRISKVETRLKAKRP